MTLNNHKFIALFIGQDDIDFKEEFKALPDEEQEAFIDFIADLFGWAMRSMKRLPFDLKVETICTSMDMFPVELRKQLSQMIISLPENGIL